MRIIGLVNKDSGPGFHRILVPLLMMNGVDAYITNSIKEEDFEKGCNTIYYNRVISDEVLNLQSKYGFKIAVDIDDYWRLDKHHVAYHDYMRNNFSRLQIENIARANVVTTTHDRLADIIYTYNQNVVVLPNAIPEHEYFPVINEPGERVRVFWQGSITHELDLRMLKYSIKAIHHDKELRDKLMMVIAGYTEHYAWDNMVSLYTNNLNLKGAVLPGVSPFEYYHNYQYADICLAPLLTTMFNSLKSNLKILEAAHAGVPVVASETHPYLNMPVLYAKDKSDWYKHIKALVNDADMREAMGQQLKQYCQTHHDYTAINQKRKEAIL